MKKVDECKKNGWNNHFSMISYIQKINHILRDTLCFHFPLWSTSGGVSNKGWLIELLEQNHRNGSAYDKMEHYQKQQNDTKSGLEVIMKGICWRWLSRWLWFALLAPCLVKRRHGFVRSAEEKGTRGISVVPVHIREIRRRNRQRSRRPHGFALSAAEREIQTLTTIVWTARIPLRGWGTSA